MLTITCTMDYPTAPPQITFQNKVNLGCVDGSGNVDFGSIGSFTWSPSESMETALIGLYNEMTSGSNKSRPQPGEGETY